MLTSVSVGRVGRLVRFGRHTRRSSSSLVCRMSSSAASPDAEANDAGASNLCHRLADQIVNGKSSKHNSPRLCLAIAGGGSPALSALTSTPNASSALVEGVVAYDRRSFADYIGAHPPPASAIVSQLTTGQDGIGKSNTSGFSFSSPTSTSTSSLLRRHGRGAGDGRAPPPPPREAEVADRRDGHPGRDHDPRRYRIQEGQVLVPVHASRD